MKPHTLKILLLGLLLPTGSVWAESTVTLEVANLSCQICPNMFIKSLKLETGVLDVQISEKSNIATVIYDETKIDVSTIIKMAMFSGYPSKILSEKHHHRSTENQRDLPR